jgi:hypothetical protein
MSVVEAVCESTERYLEFLRAQKQGNTHHDIHSITALKDPLPLGGVLHFTYRGQLPLRLSVVQDSSATLILEPAPDKEIAIHILEYDRSNGRIEFASREPIVGEKGQFLIDYVWLVERCLKWYRNRGVTIPLSLPAIIDGRLDVTAESLPAELSPEKLAAIQNLLGEPFSYIWGPPGTGKTNWVLAKAAKFCLDRGEKIIVLASTNLAVDNALEAILKEGIPEDDVLRLGVPGVRFVDAHRKCCEARAFQQEIAHLRVEIANLESAIQAAEGIIRIEDRLPTDQKELARLEAELEASQTQLRFLAQEQANCLRLHQEAEQALVEKESERNQVDQDLNSLKFDELVSEILDLESEQTQAIRTRSKLARELEGMSWAKKLISRRKPRIEALLRAEDAHLRSVEGTLDSKRAKHDSLSPEVAHLKLRLQELTEFCESAQKAAIEAKRHRDSIATQLQQNSLKSAESRRGKKAVVSAIREREHLIRILKDSIREKEPARVDEMRQRRGELEAELMKYEPDLARKPVLGMTLDGYIGLTLTKSLAVDRIFIDEAPYAPLAKVIPLLGLRRPIAMLGDHKQLPPVCECDNDAVIEAFWAKPSIFFEDAFRLPWNDGESSFEALHTLSEPALDQLKLRKLTNSYRFGPSLARLLDRHIYEMGLSGVAESDTLIRCFHCEPYDQPGRSNRQNPAECDSILAKLAEWWKWAEEINPTLTIAVLTPYKAQATLLKKHIRKRFGSSGPAMVVEVLNTHQAQGREWDWVLFSVADTGRLKGNNPFFSDTNCHAGKPLVNTTLSRAKVNLWIFLDQVYWKRRAPGSLVTDLATNFSA